ncbi:MAG: hypothetical protein GOMPHAMPRED_001384 [Gomphillus americanus]|uniref:Signal recognition particle subunit SRP14 n=1 Tax=Gomphillus americanus TaxID=1940652 RepID=A0A8H3F4F5_9LECA|nr:MAG: hypothetical protein GOMPHAMPRED_001384 [Gomphillus americanus]
MAEHHLSAEEFLARLRQLFASTSYENHSRSVFLTQKRLTPHTTAPTADSLSDLNPTQPFPILIRATNGKSREKKGEKIKLSTIVQDSELDNFFTRYAELCKTGMSNLKKRDRGAQKAKLKAKKEKERKAKEAASG